MELIKAHRLKCKPVPSFPTEEYIITEGVRKRFGYFFSCGFGGDMFMLNGYLCYYLIYSHEINGYRA